MAGPPEISEAIWRVLKRQAPVLFTGAGVGRRVDLPDWRTYMELLAAECEKWGDRASAALIRERVGRNQYLTAGTVFKTSDLIPEGEKWRALAAPFVTTLPNDRIERLVPLVELPFTGVVSTNYDHTIQETCVHAQKWFVPIERGDGTLRGAMFQKDFIIARIHGRAEMPQTMAVATDDYHKLQGETDYLDFLLEIFRSRTCLFVGFSFLDPAIELVLRIYASKHGPTFNALHAALIPAGATELDARLRAVNVEVISYDPADGHGDL